MSLWLFPHLPPTFAIFIFFSSHFTCCCQHQNYQMDPRPHEATEAGVHLGASATRVLLTWPKGTQGAATPACRHLPAPSSGCALAQPTLHPAPCPEGNPTGERSPPTPRPALSLVVTQCFLCPQLICVYLLPPFQRDCFQVYGAMMQSIRWSPHLLRSSHLCRWPCPRPSAALDCGSLGVSPWSGCW